MHANKSLWIYDDVYTSFTCLHCFTYFLFMFLWTHCAADSLRPRSDITLAHVRCLPATVRAEKQKSIVYVRKPEQSTAALVISSTPPFLVWYEPCRVHLIVSCRHHVPATAADENSHAVGPLTMQQGVALTGRNTTSRWRPSAILDLLYACLDHPRSVFWWSLSLCKIWFESVQ